MCNIEEEIKGYFSSSSQYPYLVVVPSGKYKDVLYELSTIPTINVSDYCVDDDKEPDIDKLHDYVAHVTGKHLLIGLGDYLANKNCIAKRTLLSYKDMNLSKNSRVAILLSPYMYPLLKEIYNSDPRVRGRISLPKTEPHIPTPNNDELAYGMRAYLKACESGEPLGVVRTSLNLNTADVLSPDNAYDELKRKFPIPFNKLYSDFGTRENWQGLLSDIKSIDKNIYQFLSSKRFDPPEHFFLEYAKRRDYDAWLYFIYLKLCADDHSYLGLVASNANKLEDLFKEAKCAILNIDVYDRRFDQFYNERKSILKNCVDADIADYVVKTAIRDKDRIAYLTDNTKSEKQAMIESLCNDAKDCYIKKNYPDLHFYLQDFLFNDDKLTSYFSLYKKHKVSNQVSEDFLKLVDVHARERTYNSLPARSSFIPDLGNEDTYLIFLDAFGVEYLGFIKEKCAAIGLRFIANIARAELPTITMFNRDFYEDWQGNAKTTIKDLDKLKHHEERSFEYNNSPYPIHLSEELDVVTSILERAKSLLLNGHYKKVLVVSDHGASRLAVIKPDIQIPNNNCTVRSNGRYCYGGEPPEGDNIVTKNGSEYAVISNYSRFTSSRAASVEVHGGATLEEVIVPVIELTLMEPNIEIKLENNIIEVDYKTTPSLYMFITPSSENITAIAGGKPCTVVKVSANKFKVTVHDLKKGTYMLDIYENQNKIGNKEITIKGKGFAERDLF